MKNEHFFTVLTPEEAKIEFRKYVNSEAQSYIDTIKGNQIDFIRIAELHGCLPDFKPLSFWNRLETENPPVSDSEFFEAVLDLSQIGDKSVLIWPLESWNENGNGHVYLVRGENIIQFSQLYPSVSSAKSPAQFIQQEPYFFFVLEERNLIIVHTQGFIAKCRFSN